MCILIWKVLKKQILENSIISLNLDDNDTMTECKIFKIIDDYINNCEHEYKDLFYDYYFNGIKQKELAKRYNLSQGQVSRKIKSIIKCLQELLKDYK